MPTRQESAHEHRLIAIAAIAGLTGLSSIGAHAFQGEQNPLPPQPFQSTASRATIAAEARNPVKISNGGTGVTQPRSGEDRASVRAQARSITPEGAATYGEVTDRRL